MTVQNEPSKLTKNKRNIDDWLGKVVIYEGIIESWVSRITTHTDVLLVNVKVRDYTSSKSNTRKLDHLWCRYNNDSFLVKGRTRLDSVSAIGKVIEYTRYKDQTDDYAISPRAGHSVEIYGKCINYLRKHFSTIRLKNKTRNRDVCAYMYAHGCVLTRCLKDLSDKRVVFPLINDYPTIIDSIHRELEAISGLINKEYPDLSLTFKDEILPERLALKVKKINDLVLGPYLDKLFFDTYKCPKSMPTKTHRGFGR